MQATAIPKEMAQRISQLESEAYFAWVEARKASDWSKFAPYLSQWIQLTKEKCQLIDPDRPAYDVCLDEYEVKEDGGRPPALSFVAPETPRRFHEAQRESLKRVPPSPSRLPALAETERDDDQADR